MGFGKSTIVVFGVLAAWVSPADALASYKAIRERPHIARLEIQSGALLHSSQASVLKAKEHNMDDSADIAHQYSEDKESTKKSTFHRRSHAEGLEAEHSGDQTHWKLTAEDRLEQANFLEQMNAEGGDVCFKWHDLNCCKRENDGGECFDNCTWTWSETAKAGAKSAQEALVGHLIHRHGIGALLASRAGPVFDEYHRGNVVIENASGRVGFEALTSSIENFPDVAKVRSLLLNMTLSGIRNLHSFDHTWSAIKGAGVMPGCGRAMPIGTSPSTWGVYFTGGGYPPGNCALQAETSEKAYLLMKDKGFNSSSRVAAKAKAEEIEDNYPAAPATYYMDDEFHTGEHWINGTRPQYQWYSYSSGTYNKNSCEGKVAVTSGWFSSDLYIEGLMCWEAGGTTNVKVPISSTQKEQIDNATAGQDQEQVMMQIIDKYMQEQKKDNMMYITERWLTYFAGEDADFSATYEIFKEHSFDVSSPPACDSPEAFGIPTTR